MKKTILILLITLTSSIGFSQKKSAEEIIKITTTAECDECKERLETALSYEKGISKSNLDVPTKIVTVHYNPKKITPEKIRKAISKTGYDADEVKADTKAYNKLPACCKIGGGQNQ